MEPSEVAVEIACCDTAEAAQEVLELAVAAVDGLDMEGAAHPFSGGQDEGFVAEAERLRARRVSAVSVGDEEACMRAPVSSGGLGAI